MNDSFLSISIEPIDQKPGYDYSLLASPRLLKKWELKQNAIAFLKIGKKEVLVHVLSAEIPPHKLKLSTKLLNEFFLPCLETKFTAKYIPEKNIIQLGPIVALLTDFHFNEANEPDFRSVHAFCEELHHGIFTSGGFFYVFQLDGYSNKSIHGYYFRDGNWIYEELPLPDVIYNRIHSRKIECSEAFRSFQKSVGTVQIPFFNERFLSKWEVHTQLLQEEYMHPYLPETVLFSKENLNDMILRHDTLFIKPIHGSQGRSIIKLVKKDDTYTLQISYLSSGSAQLEKHSIDTVFRYLQPLAKKKQYIIQQGANLSAFAGRPMDFRVLCHKNEQELWKVTSLVARISSEQHFVSNIARGGEVMKPTSALSTCFTKENSGEIISLMKELSIETATILSSNTSGLIGELGVDIGIDVSGKLWIIEINSKPSKNFEDPGQKIRPSARSILAYCTMLAFKAPSEQEA